LNYVPVWTIQPQSVAGMGVKFNETDVFDTRLLQS